jgi:hypothetical protein
LSRWSTRWGDATSFLHFRFLELSNSRHLPHGLSFRPRDRAESAVEAHRTIAKNLGIDPDVIEPYGRTKAKLPLDLIDETNVAKSKLILVTALSPHRPVKARPPPASACTKV